MKKYLFLLIPLIVACTSKNPKETIVKASFPNFSDSIVLFYTNGIPDTIRLDSNQSFSLKVSIDKPTYFLVKAKRARTYFYAKPNDTTNFVLDCSDAANMPKFIGESADLNNYVAVSNLRMKDLYSDWNGLFSVGKDTFALKMDSVEKSLNGLLDSLNLKDTAIVALEKTRISYFIKSVEVDYPESNDYVNGIEEEHKVYDYSFLKDLDINNEYHLMFDDYKTLVGKYTSYLFYSGIDKAEFDKKSNADQKKDLFAFVDKQVTNQEVKDYIKMMFLYDDLLYGNFFELSDVVKKFLTDCKNSICKSTVDKLFTMKMQVAPGKPSPNFTYKDINGKEVSLTDFRGNLVYIDLWATWCGPCKHEIPFLEKLQDEYKGKKITFISISLDENYEAWTSMVKDKKMKGNQLFAEGAWSSSIAKAFFVKSIPTFIMIDAQGNILSPYAPRPSSEEIKVLIDENLK